MQLPCLKYPRGIISEQPTTNATFDHLKGFLVWFFTVPDGELGT